MSILTVIYTSPVPITVQTLTSNAVTSPTTIASGTSTVRTTSTSVSAVAFGQSSSATSIRPLLGFALAPAVVAMTSFLYVVL